jgi:hypothetical protein
MAKLYSTTGAANMSVQVIRGIPRLKEARYFEIQSPKSAATTIDDTVIARSKHRGDDISCELFYMCG